MKDNARMDIWKERGLEEDREYAVYLGPLCLRLRRVEDEWLVAYDYNLETVSTEPDFLEKEKSDSVVWSRFVVNGHFSDIKLIPVLPDRPVVVSSENPIMIMPGSSALFFVTVPVWVRLCTGKNGTITLTDIPSAPLSNTWFGDPLNGELAYSSRTQARRTAAEAPSLPNRVICPVRVGNSSTEPLDLQKLCIHVEHLKVYREKPGESHSEDGGTNRLWTNEVLITFYGIDLMSKIDYTKELYPIKGTYELMSGERVPYDTGLLKRSVGILKYFTHFES